MDNVQNKGLKEIPCEKVLKMKKGEEIILALRDSTKVYGNYQGCRESNDSKKEIIVNSNTVEGKTIMRNIELSEVNKYYYKDKGGNVWIAAAIGAAVDTFLIYLFSRRSILSGGIRLL